MNRRIGQILLDRGKLTEEDLSLALVSHKRLNIKLGQVLMREGVLTEPELADTLAVQNRCGRYEGGEGDDAGALADLIPVDLARRLQLAPVRRRRSLLTVAMPNPGDLSALEAAEEHTGMEVMPEVCTEAELNDLITLLYGERSVIDDMLDDISVPDHVIESDDEDLRIDMIQDLAEEAPVISAVNNIISRAVHDRASDVHISQERDAGMIRFRIDGALHTMSRLTRGQVLPIISRVKIMANLDISVFRRSQDGRISRRMAHRDIDIRVSTLPTVNGEVVVMRILDQSVGSLTLGELGMTEADQKRVLRMLARPYGMVLSTGPTGSGKTTTLYAILRYLNSSDINIITLEDPVEYRLERIRQTQLNEKADMQFADGIRSLLRQDPDVIMVGEIRDSETAAVAIQAGLTGHRILSTLHTNDAAGAITRFIDMKIAPFLISSVLLVSIGQRLVRRLCLFCREPHVPPQSVLREWNIEDNGNNSFYLSKGCAKCLQTGYRDRTGVFEVLTMTDEIQQMILSMKSASEINRYAFGSGMFKGMSCNAVEKVTSGVTTFNEALSVAILR